MSASSRYKITVRLEKRDDGGLRVWSEDLPSLVLSNRDPDRVLEDLIPALEALLSDLLGSSVEVAELLPIAAAAKGGAGAEPLWSGHMDFAATAH